MGIYDEFEDIRKEYDRKLSVVFSQLTEDIIIVEKCLENGDNQTWRRIYVRCVVSAIEALLESVKSGLNINSLSTKVESRLTRKNTSQEANPNLTEKKRKRLELLKDLAIHYEAYINQGTPRIKINKQSLKWDELATLIKIRNRITHPKHLSDLKITDKEITRCKAAYIDFLESSAVLFAYHSSTNSSKDFIGFDDSLFLKV